MKTKEQEEYAVDFALLENAIHLENNPDKRRALIAGHRALVAEYKAKYYRDHGGRLVPRDLEADEIDDYLDHMAELSPMDHGHSDDCPIHAAERRMGA